MRQPRQHTPRWPTLASPPTSSSFERNPADRAIGDARVSHGEPPRSNEAADGKEHAERHREHPYRPVAPHMYSASVPSRAHHPRLDAGRLGSSLDEDATRRRTSRLRRRSRPTQRAPPTLPPRRMTPGESRSRVVRNPSMTPTRRRTEPSSTSAHDLRATIDERRVEGRAARSVAPRRTLEVWDPAARGHDALTTILAQNATRAVDLLPIRHGRMAASPWNYYRGAAAVMAADLASRPNSGLHVQLCGDAHVLNFGLWATPERNLLFDLRDFDESLPGPFEWDVARLAASLVVAARESGVRRSTADDAVLAAVTAYRDSMRRAAGMHELDVWYQGTHVDSLVQYFEPADRNRVTVHIEKKKERRTSRGSFAKLTTMIDGRPRIDEDPPIRVTITDA